MSKRESRRRKRERFQKFEFYSRNKKKEDHRDIWSREYGPIPPGFHVHHINCNHYDNRLENLVALPDWYHSQIHRDMQFDPSLSNLYTIEYLLPRYLEFKSLYEDHARRLEEVNRQFKESIQKYRQEAHYHRVERVKRSGIVFKDKRTRITERNDENQSIIDRWKLTKRLAGLVDTGDAVRDLGYDLDQDPFDNPRDFS